MKTALRMGAQTCVAFCLVLFGLAPIAVKGQIPAPPVTAHSPSVAAFANAHSVAAGPYTGTVSASVPLYTLQIGELSLPIGLRYASQGFKPDEQPGWLGMGWSLEAGGTISRNVQDLPDQLTMKLGPFNPVCQDLQTSYSGSSPFKNAGFFWMPLWSQSLQNSWLAHDLKKLASSDAVIATSCFSNDPDRPLPGLSNILDTEPDIFSFSAPGLSGSFYLRDDFDNLPRSCRNNAGSCRWQVRCDRPVRVELLFQSTDTIRSLAERVLLPAPFENTALSWREGQNRSADPLQPGSFKGFVLTADDGTRYTFGGVTNAIEYSTSLWQQHTDYWVANAWHLTSIEYANGQVIRYDYDLGAMPLGPAASAALLGPSGLVWPGIYTKQFFYTARREGNLMDSTGTTPHNTSAAAPIPNNPWENVDGRLVRPSYLHRIYEQGSAVSIVFQRSWSNTGGWPGSHSNDMEQAAALRYCPPNTNPISTQTGPCYVSRMPMGGSAGYPQLDEIIVYAKRLTNHGLDTVTQAVKRFAFAYHAPPLGRRQLLSVRESGTDAASSLPPYQFSYYANPQGGALPDYFTGEVDHWGFFNNAAAVNNTPPNWYNPTLIAQSRAPLPRSETNRQLAQMGMLAKMVSPLGEETEFTYEQHTYGSIYNVSWSNNLAMGSPVLPCRGVAGGVRLHRVSRRPTVGDPSQRWSVRYAYQKPDTLTASSGVLAGNPMYYFNNYRVSTADDGAGHGRQFLTSIFSIHSALPTLNGAGAHIGYTHITEIYADSSRKLSAYSNYFYDSAGAYGTADAPLGPNSCLGDLTPYGPFVVFEENRGKLASETWSVPDPLAPNGFRKTRYHRLFYSYAPVAPQPNNPSPSPLNVGVSGIRITSRQYNGQHSLQNYRLLEAVHYLIPTASALPTLDETTIYEPGSAEQSIKKRFRYNSQGVLIAETTLDPLTNTTASPDSLHTKYFYASNLPDTIAQYPAWLVRMKAWRQWRYPLEVVQMRGTRVVGVSAYTYGYDFRNNLQVFPSLTRQSSLSQPLAGSYQPWTHRNQPPNALKMRPIAQVFSYSGTLPENVLQETAAIGTYWWDYNYR